MLSQWWSYRRLDRSKPPMGDKRPPSKKSSIQPTIWPAEYTTELLALLRVLTRLVALEPQQADLLVASWMVRRSTATPSAPPVH